jgi:hypothetical protein
MDVDYQQIAIHEQLSVYFHYRQKILSFIKWCFLELQFKLIGIN